MTEGERKELFSEKIVAGRRTYFFDVKESIDGTRYLVISESKQVSEEDYEHHRIMVFQEHIPIFVKGLNKALKFMKRISKTKAYEVEEIRQKYPKAYMKWTKEEEDALRNYYLQGKTIDELAIFSKENPALFVLACKNWVCHGMVKI